MAKQKLTQQPEKTTGFTDDDLVHVVNAGVSYKVKFTNFLGWIASKAITFAQQITFTLAPKLNSVGANKYVKTNASNEVEGVSNIPFSDITGFPTIPNKATQLEVDTGTNDTTYITPLTHQQNVYDGLSVFEFKYSKQPNWNFEDFIQSNLGNIIAFTSSTGSGGSLATELPETQPNWNGVTSKGRLGQSSVRITNGNNSRSAIFSASNYRTLQNLQFGFGAEFSIGLGGQVDFANDPTLIGFGFLDNFALNNPLNGFYVRPPRTTESAFLKYVVRIAGVETVFSTTISYDNTARRFIKAWIFWNGTDLVIKATDESDISTNIITNFNATYPAIASLNFAKGCFNIRNGSPTVGVARHLNIDRVFEYIGRNFQNI